MDDGMLHVGDEAVPEGVPEEIDGSAMYRVQLAAPIEIAPNVWLSPGARQEISGDLVLKFKDSIYGAVKQDPG